MSPERFRVLPTPYEQQVNREKTQREWNKSFLIAGFTIPGFFVFALFLLIPMAQSAVFSLYDWNGFGPPTDYVGLGNFTRLLNHSIFQASVGHSLILMALSLLIQLPLALGLALLVGRGKMYGRRLFRTILFVPFVFSEVITAIIWRYVLHPADGLLNALLMGVIPGFEPIGWLADRNIVLIAIFAVITWKFFGLHMILYMAGLQGVPSDLEDAARVDGANERQVLSRITLPLLSSTIRLTVFLSVLGSFQQFVIIWSMTEGGPVNASEVMATYLYKFGIQRFNLGYGSSVAIVLFALMLVFSLGYQRIVMRQDYTTDRGTS